MSDRIVYVADALPNCDQWVPMIWVQLDDPPSPLGQFGVFYDSRFRRFTVHRENGSSSYSIPRAPGEDGAVYAWMPEPPIPPPDKSPAPFHYVTEKLPEEGQQIRFWLRGLASPCYGQYLPSSCPSAPWGIWSGASYRIDDGTGGVYAWAPEPPTPPLPEDGR